MRNVIVLVLALMSSAAFAASDASQIQQLQNATKACKAKGFKTVGEQEDCVHAAYVKIKSGVPERGALYAEKNYKNLSKAQAEGKLLSLQKEYNKAPKGTYFKGSKKAGVVDRISIMNEGWWIQKKHSWRSPNPRRSMVHGVQKRRSLVEHCSSLPAR